MREILKRNNMPEDLFIVIEEPSKDLSQELMRQCDLTFATGGRDMVRAAYSSGKPAYGVGTGNCPSVIDETADLADAAHKVMLGKIGDNVRAVPPRTPSSCRKASTTSSWGSCRPRAATSPPPRKRKKSRRSIGSTEI